MTKSVMAFIVALTLLQLPLIDAEYHYVATTDEYDNAEWVCENTYGGHLASITDQADNDIVRGLCPVECLIGLDNRVGLTTWSDGTTVTYTNWQTAPGDSSEPQVTIHANGEWTTIGTAWKPYICESFTSDPSASPSANPSASPSTPTKIPSITPSSSPTGGSDQPTAYPSTSPTEPTSTPTSAPTAPSASPSANPSISPTRPSANPSATPSSDPSISPTRPSATPSATPSDAPSSNPSATPSVTPSATPSSDPSISPSADPSTNPSISPTRPSATPSSDPSAAPTLNPSATPSSNPSTNPTTPSSNPSGTPSATPSVTPSDAPSSNPSANPSATPSDAPSSNPSAAPTINPSAPPSDSPSSNPSTPSRNPSANPSTTPSKSPSADPSAAPSSAPTIAKYFTSTSATPGTWSEAQTWCNDQGASLASVHSLDDFNTAKRICEDLIASKQSSYGCWIGLNNRDAQTQFIWSDGSDSDYGFTANDPSQPTDGVLPWHGDATPGSANANSCVINRQGAAFGYKWTVLDCDTTAAAYPICNIITDAPTKSPTKSPSSDPTMSPTRKTCTKNVNYVMDGRICSIEGDPHTITFSNIRHDFQGQPGTNGAQYYYVKKCAGEAQEDMPFSILMSHKKFPGHTVSGVQYAVLELFDDDGTQFVSFFSGAINNYAEKTTGVTTSYEDNVANTVSFTDIAASTDTAIGNRFSIRYTKPNANEIVVILTIDGACTVDFRMRLFTWGSSGFYYHNVYITPPPCYRCFLCGLCGDLKRASSLDMETCDGGFVTVQSGWGGGVSFAWDTVGNTWEASHCTARRRRRLLLTQMVEYTPTTGVDFTYIEPCDSSIEAAVIAECQTARDAAAASCDTLATGATFCEDLQEFCEIDACAASGSDASLITANVQNIFTDALGFVFDQVNVAGFDPALTVATVVIPGYQFPTEAPSAFPSAPPSSAPTVSKYFTSPTAESGTWSDAQTWCNDQGVSVASVHSLEDFDTAKRICTTLIAAKQSSYGCWIGLNNRDVQTKFIWSDGSDSDYGFTANDPSQPTDGVLPWYSEATPGSADANSCVIMRQGARYGYQWIVYDCDSATAAYPICNTQTNNPTKAPTKTPTALPSTAPTRKTCEKNVNYVLDGQICWVTGDPHTGTFANVRHDVQGQPGPNGAQYYYVKACAGEYQQNMPFSILLSHRRLSDRHTVSSVNYAVLELFDEDGTEYVAFLGGAAQKYVEKTTGVTTSYEDNVDNSVVFTDITASTDTAIGSRFSIRYTHSGRRVTVVLTIDGTCTVTFYMDVWTYSGHTFHNVYITPPPCYRCFVCGLCGDLKRAPSNTMETCGGGLTTVQSGWGAHVAFAWDATGNTWEVSHCNSRRRRLSEPVMEEYVPVIGDDFVYIDPCDASIEAAVITACQAARDAAVTCCDIIGGTFCDELQGSCEVDACAVAAGNESAIAGSVQELFTDAVDFVCVIPDIGDLFAENLTTTTVVLEGYQFPTEAPTENPSMATEAPTGSPLITTTTEIAVETTVQVEGSEEEEDDKKKGDSTGAVVGVVIAVVVVVIIVLIVVDYRRHHANKAGENITKDTENYGATAKGDTELVQAKSTSA